MSDKKDKKLLPMHGVKQALQRFRELTDLVIPPLLSGSTSLTRCTDAHRSFETSDHAGQTISEMLDAYERNEPLGIKDVEPSNGEQTYPLADPEKLKATLGRSSVEEYRASKGLDKLREQLISSLIKLISFETGVSKVAAHIDALRLLDDRADLALRKIKTNLLSPEQKVRYAFPDMTAEEAAWLSIAQVDRSGILFTVPAPFFYPVTLVDVDIDGLRFAFGTVNDDNDNSCRATSAQQLAGVTGDNVEYRLVPFEYNVAQVIKAVVLLSINDDDLFRRIWGEHDETPIRRGDAMMAKAILKSSKPADVDWDQNLDHLRWKGVVTRADIDLARERVRNYAQTKLCILDSPVRTVLDFLRLVGMLQRAPSFAEKQDAFRGYAKLYGTNVEFINEAGVIVDSVPLHEHIMLTTSYKFNDQIGDISRRNHVAEEIFGQLRTAVYHSITDAGQQLLPDQHQAEIFDAYTIFTPVSGSKTTRECNAVEMLRAHLVTNELVERSMKFSHEEFLIIKDVLSRVPRDLLRNVRSITKEVSHSFTLKSLRAEATQAGSYDPSRQQITISLPIETPCLENRNLASFLEMFMGTPSERQARMSAHGKLAEHKAYFVHALLHEIGESVWAMMPEPVREAWKSLTPDSGSITNMYLTSYARTSCSEDFCESFAIFYTHGKTFRRLSKKRPVLAAKYEFVRKLWCSDGSAREFDDFRGVTLSALHGKADEDPCQRLLEDDIREAMLSEIWSRDEERGDFAEHVLSYEQLCEERLEDAEVGDFEEAARRFDRRKEMDDRDEVLRKRRIILMVHNVTERALVDLKVHSLAVKDRFFECLQLGNSDEAQELLKQAGAKPKAKVASTVTRLIRLYAEFAEELDIDADDKHSICEGLEITLAMIEALSKKKKPDGK